MFTEFGVRENLSRKLQTILVLLALITTLLRFKGENNHSRSTP